VIEAFVVAVRNNSCRMERVQSLSDECSTLGVITFRGTQLHVFDFFDPQRMTEPSIARARELARNQPRAEAVDFRSLPLSDEELDAAFLIFAAHELREPEARVALLRELHRSLKHDGELILVEHLRDLPNFIAFGPGFLHFHSRSQWLGGFAAAGLRVTKEFALTPFVRVLALAKT